MSAQMDEQVTINLTQGDLYNLNQFLNTVQLTGKEAMVFAQLVSKINQQATPTKTREVV
jgi:hypothetical protein